MTTLQPRPTLLQKIADLIGEDAMNKLWRARTGTRCYLTVSSQSAWLVSIIGQDAAAKLCSQSALSSLSDSNEPNLIGIWITLPIFHETQSVSSFLAAQKQPKTPGKKKV